MSGKLGLTESVQTAHRRLNAVEKRVKKLEEGDYREYNDEVDRFNMEQDKKDAAREALVNDILDRLDDLEQNKVRADEYSRAKDRFRSIEKHIDNIESELPVFRGAVTTTKGLEERVNCIAENLQELITAPGPLHARVKALEEHACGKIGVIALERSCGMADHQPAAPKPEATCGECRLFGECLRTMSKLNPEAEGCLPGNLLREAEERAKKNIVGLRQLVAEENAKHQMEQARAEKAEAKATQYEQDWYSAKSEFGDAMAKMRTRLREAEARVKELEDISHGTKATAEESCEIQEKLCDSCMRRFRADERERVAQHFEDYPNWTKSFPASKDVVKVIRAMPDRGKPK